MHGVIDAAPPEGRSSKWSVGGGGPLRYQVNPADGEAVERLAKKLGCDPTEILEAVEEARMTLEPEPPPPAAVEPVIVAHDRSGGSVPATFDTLAEALVMPYSDFRWDGLERLACLDIDIDKGGSGFSESDLQAALGAPGPSPRYAWLSKSGGMHLIYGPCERHGLTAEQRAGLAALLLDACHHANTVRVELLPRTAAPPEGHEVYHRGSEYTVANLRGYLLGTGGCDSVTPESVFGWLAANGMRVGSRYPHSRCPRNPSETSGTDPVVVTDDGVRCYSGGCGAGFMPWASLVDRDPSDPEIDPVTLAALERVHWTHARLILQASRPLLGDTDTRAGDMIRRAGYEALLRVLHPDEDTDSVWRSDLQFLRGETGWLHSDTLGPFVELSGASLSALAWVGESGPRRDRAASDARLRGYAPIEPVLWLAERPSWSPGMHGVMVPVPFYRGSSDLQMTFDEARDVMRASMPGLSEEWLRAAFALVVAGLLGQTGGHTPPMTLLRGQSGSGKGAAVMFASGVLGRSHGVLDWSNEQELARSVGMACEARCPQVFGDEIGKVSGWFRLSSALLRLNDYVGWRKLYAGHVVTRCRTSIVLAGSTVPQGLATMAELNRRAATITLPRLDPRRTAEWEGALAENLGAASLLRLRDSDEGAAIATAYIEEALRVFRAAQAEGATKWPTLAGTLGLQRLCDDEDTEDLHAIVRRLYYQWCLGLDEVTVQDGRRHGWLRCWFTGEADGAAEALTDWVSVEDPEHVQLGKIGTLETVDVVSACDLPSDSQVSLKVWRRGPRSNRWYVRFSDSLTGRGSLDRLDRSRYPHPVSGWKGD